MTMAETDVPSYFSRTPRFVDLAIVFVLGLLINGYMLGDGPLAGTEGHRALTAHQMVTSGQWLLPKLYDQYYLRKPALHYWILGGLEILTGRADAWIWRLPSVIAAALLGIFFCWITNRWYGRLAGLVAGLSCAGWWRCGGRIELLKLMRSIRSRVPRARAFCWIWDMVQLNIATG
jgi:hypothetical protein